MGAPATAAIPGQRPARIAPPPRGPEPAGRGQPPRARHGEPPRGQDPSREIESWLGELRNGTSAGAKGGHAGEPAPSADETRAIPAQRPAPTVPPDNEPTTAIPAQRPKSDASEADDDAPTRRGGGVSAQDLLRREGRL